MQRILVIGICLVIVLVARCSIAAQTAGGLTQAQAVEIAERLVAQKGYSDETRPNAIQPRAFIAGIKDRSSFWSVQFLFRKQAFERKYDLGREVRISLDGRTVWMSRNVVRVRRHVIPDAISD